MIKPIGTMILIKIDQPKTETLSGLLLGTAVKKKLTGVVVEVSNGTKQYDMKLKIGDRVKYQNNAGALINYLDSKCLLISELQCIAIV
jgi:co-chaperonin GroES (HSP10)